MYEMDENLIKIIEDRGYDPTVFLAVLEGLRSGMLNNIQNTHRAVVFKTISEKYQSTQEPREVNKSRKYQNIGKTCTCSDCGERIYCNVCPHCGHDNYEIMAIKGEPIKGGLLNDEK